jgi:hypothetical protein
MMDLAKKRKPTTQLPLSVRPGAYLYHPLRYLLKVLPHATPASPAQAKNFCTEPWEGSLKRPWHGPPKRRVKSDNLIRLISIKFPIFQSI